MTCWWFCYRLHAIYNIVHVPVLKRIWHIPHTSKWAYSLSFSHKISFVGMALSKRICLKHKVVIWYTIIILNWKISWQLFCKSHLEKVRNFLQSQWNANSFINFHLINLNNVNCPSYNILFKSRIRSSTLDKFMIKNTTMRKPEYTRNGYTRNGHTIGVLWLTF